MAKNYSKKILIIGLLTQLAFMACIRRNPSNLPPLEINLYGGIDQVARLGDTESKVLQRAAWAERKTVTPPQETAEYSFGPVYFFPDAGMRVYFRFGYVALIEVQEPFNGPVHGKKLRLFSFSTAPGDSWEETLRKEFGPPNLHADGGRLGSQALFYSWGDIAFNRMGPNQVALYRDPAVLKYRQKYFGRVVTLFNN
ncbi:MAG: hypothetical protein HY537_09290 [Deltaproteobacteria bacterium]|nr:hypothetical protein [Deltaproteobacteria bacterium]